MVSSQDGFDVKKMRREIFEARNTNIWMVLEFIAELARVLTQKGRQHDFVCIADRLVGLLQGNVRFKNLMFCKIASKCDVECEGMLKYYIEFEKVLSNCIGRIDILIKIGVRYFKTACYREGIEYMLKADNIADELKDKARKYVCCVNVGHAYLRLADYDKATEYYNKGLEISTSIRDRSGIAVSNGSLGNVYRILGRYDQAIEYYNTGLVISTSIRDRSGIAVSNGSLGVVYRLLGHYDQAIEYLKEGLRISTELKEQSGIAACCENLGIVYSSMGQYKTAIEYYDKGLAISSEIGDRLGIASNNEGLGPAYHNLGQYKKAIGYFEIGLTIRTDIGSRSEIASNNENLGIAYSSMGQYKTAIEYYDKGLAISSEIGDRLGIASNNEGLGAAYLNLGQYKKAIGYFEIGLTIRTDIGSRSEIASNNENLGIVYMKMGQYEKAIDSYNKGLKISTEIGDRSKEASIVGHCGMVYCCLGQYEKAKEYCNGGLELSTEVGYRLGIATNNEHLGNVYFSSGQYKKAIAYFEKSLEISTEMGNRLGISSNNVHMGQVYMKIGQYAKAVKYYKQALVISTEIGHRSGVGITCGNLGDAYLKMGKHAKAVEHYNEALAINIEIGDRSSIASDNNDLGNAYTELGQYEKAIEYLNRALEINSEIGNCKGRACNYGCLGDAYNRLGQYEKVVEYLNKGLAISSEIGDQSGIARGNGILGGVYYKRKQHEKAIECFKKSLKISTEIGDLLGIASCCGIIGNVGLSSGEFEKAIDCLNEFLAINSEIGTQSAIMIGNGNLGVAYLKVGDYEKAISLFQKCYELSVEIGDPLSECMSLGNMGCSHFLLSRQIPCEFEAMSKLQHAVSLIQRSVQVHDKIVFDLSVDENKISFSTEYFGRYVTLMRCFILLKRITAALLVIDLSKAKALLAFMEKRKKLHIVDYMACYVHEIWRKIDHSEEDMQIDDFRKAIQLKENNSTILFYSFDEDKFLNIWVLNAEDRVRYGILRLSQDLTLPEDYIFSKLEMFLEFFSVELSRDSSMYKLDSDSSLGAQPKITEMRWSQMLLYHKFVDAKEKSNVSDLENSKNMHLQKSHSCNSIFLHNILDNSELKIEELVEVVQRYDLAIDVVKLRSPVKQSSVNCANTTEAVPILQALFQALIHPVKKFIKGTKLIIVPDNFLFFVPFCALLDENSCPLSEHYSVQITPSLQTLYSRVKEPHDASLGFALFVGNPTVGEVSSCGESLDVPELPNATKEAQLLASRFDAEPLVEGEAIKQRVLKCIPGASIIHIAAHGDKKRGEIFLAPNPSSSIPKEESYLLKEKDILDIKINAKLVVLCCCHTGSGQTCSEGVVGLARAFLAAGARSVLATLWRIHDAGAKVFMEKFYDEICTETPVCEALRRAMNMLRRHENHLYRDVQIWAPFTIYGEDVKFSRQDIYEIKRKSRDMTL